MRYILLAAVLAGPISLLAFSETKTTSPGDREEEAVQRPPHLRRYRLREMVLMPSENADAYDSSAVECPKVVRSNDRFWMIHTVVAREGDTVRERIGLAVSDDLIHWEKHGVILDVGEEGAWDGGGLSAPFPFRAGDEWIVFHVGFSEKGYEAGRSGIGIARSKDLIRWEKDPAGPVLTTSPGDEWDSGTVYQCWVGEHDGKYWMFYNAASRARNEQIGLATSTDLTHWERHPENPLLRNNTSEGSQDSRSIADPWIVRLGGKWCMFYFGYDGKNARDMMATSDDWVHWGKSPFNPILDVGPSGTYDCIHAHKPCLIEHEGVWYHFYTSVGQVGEKKHVRAIALATSGKLPGVVYR
jgi:predicted GH43/DUF377 family glycosyl hydrolase